MREPRYEIRGGATPEVTAAIGALVAHLTEGEVAARAHPPRRPRQSPWVLAWRPREIPATLPSHTYDNHGWTETAEGDAES
jgi:hypothetical protein